MKVTKTVLIFSAIVFSVLFLNGCCGDDDTSNASNKSSWRVCDNPFYKK